jgi:streptogramin lyase
MKQHVLSHAAAVAFVLAGCSARNASTLTHPTRTASYPMYVTVPGTAPGTGSIFQIDAPELVDAPSTPVEIVSGLDFPAAVTVNRKGVIYYTERPTASTGRIMRLDAVGGTPIVVADNLADPQGLAADRAGNLYVAETGSGVVSLVVNPLEEFDPLSTEDALQEVATGLAGPRSLATDENDNLYVTETGAGAVTKLIPDGTEESIATGVSNPVSAGPGLVGSLFFIAGNTGLVDGRAVRVSQDGEKETYLDRLVNPKSQAWEDGTIMYVAQGAPAFNVIKFSRVSNLRTEAASLSGEPHTIVFTPLD